MIPVNFDISTLPAPVLEMLLNATATETTTFGVWLHSNLAGELSRRRDNLTLTSDLWTVPELDDGELRQALIECADATFSIEGRQLELVDDQTRWNELSEGARLFFELGLALAKEARLRTKATIN